MAHGTFDIVFEKLIAANVSESGAEDRPVQMEIAATELDEISELRRIVLETTEPEPFLYTTT